jgi:hypothetical protein
MAKLWGQLARLALVAMTVGVAIVAGQAFFGRLGTIPAATPARPAPAPPRSIPDLPHIRIDPEPPLAVAPPAPVAPPRVVVPPRVVIPARPVARAPLAPAPPAPSAPVDRPSALVVRLPLGVRPGLVLAAALRQTIRIEDPRRRLPRRPARSGQNGISTVLSDPPKALGLLPRDPPHEIRTPPPRFRGDPGEGGGSRGLEDHSVRRVAAVA